MAVNAIKPPLIPRLRGGVKGGVVHAVASMMTKLHARRRAAHLLASHHLVIKMIATCIMIESQVHPVLACTHMMTVNLTTDDDNDKDGNNSNATSSMLPMLSSSHTLPCTCYMSRDCSRA